jgi:hypothetical protein
MIHDDVQANLSLKTLADAARLSPIHTTSVIIAQAAYS